MDAYASLMSETEGALRLLMGAFDPLRDVVFYAKLSPAVTFKPGRGTVLHLNADGEYETGATGNQVPLWLWTDASGGDVNNPGSTASGKYSHSASTHNGALMTFVGLQTILLATQRFDDEQDYAIGDFVRAVTANTNSTTGGRVTNRNAGDSAKVVAYTDPICGIVTAEPVANEWGYSSLQLLTYYLPESA